MKWGDLEHTISSVKYGAKSGSAKSTEYTMKANSTEYEYVWYLTKPGSGMEHTNIDVDFRTGYIEGFRRAASLPNSLMLSWCPIGCLFVCFCFCLFYFDLACSVLILPVLF